MATKRNLTIRIDDEMREQLEAIAEDQFRTLAMQIQYFLLMGIDSYMTSQNLVFVRKDNGKLAIAHSDLVKP